MVFSGFYVCTILTPNWLWSLRKESTGAWCLIQAQSQLPASGHSADLSTESGPQRQSRFLVGGENKRWCLKELEELESVEQLTGELKGAQNSTRICIGALLSLWLQSWVRAEWEFLLPDRSKISGIVVARDSGGLMELEDGRVWPARVERAYRTPPTFSRDWRKTKP